MLLPIPVFDAMTKLPKPEILKLNPAKAISVELSKVRLSLNSVKSKESAGIELFGVGSQVKFPLPSFVKIVVAAPCEAGKE